MDRFVTIATFTLPHEATVIKGRLEAEGIDCFLKDELTAQVYNFYSNAIGGVKLQVRETDAENAMQILSENGYLNQEDEHYAGYMQTIDRSTAHIPLLNQLRVEFRLLAIIGVSVFVLMLVAYFLTQPKHY